MKNQEIQKALEILNAKKIERVADDFPKIKRTFTYKTTPTIKTW